MVIQWHISQLREPSRVRVGLELLDSFPSPIRIENKNSSESLNKIFHGGLVSCWRSLICLREVTLELTRVVCHVDPHELKMKVDPTGKMVMRSIERSNIFCRQPLPDTPTVDV